jgi:transcriptional regulator with XRE-family HTH domain
MTPRALKAWRLRLDLSQDGLARWLGVSRSTVNRWEGGLAPIPKMVGMLAHRTAVPVVDDLACETECGCIQGVQTCNYHMDARYRTDAESAPSDRERRVHVGNRRAAGDRRANRFSPAEERYEDCDRCGERYHGEFIDRFLRDEERPGDELWRVCCTD